MCGCSGECVYSVYAQVSVVYTHRCVGVYVPLWKPEEGPKCLLSLFTSFLIKKEEEKKRKQGLSLNLKITVSFMWVLRIWTHVLLLLKQKLFPTELAPQSMGFYVYTSSLLPVVSVLFSEHFTDHKCQVFPFWEAPKKQIQNALSEFSPKFLYWLFRVLFFSRYKIQLKTEWGGTVIPTDQMLSSIKASPG